MPNNNSVNNLFLNQNVINVSSNYTVISSDVIISVTDTSAIRVITLPAPSLNNRGKFFIIKDASGAAGTNNINIIAPPNLIDGVASINIASNYGSRTLYSDGTNYFSEAAVSPLLPPNNFAQGGWVRFAATAFVPGSTIIQTSATVTTLMSASGRLDLSSLTVVTPIVNLTVGAQNITFLQSGIYHIIVEANIGTGTFDPVVQLVKNNATVVFTSIANSNDASDRPAVSIFNIDKYAAGDTIDFRFGKQGTGATYLFSSIGCFVQQLPITFIP